MAKKKNGKVKEDKSFEEKLWSSAEKLRESVSSSQYKHIVLGLLFLKFSSDIFENRRHFLEKETKNPDNKEYFQKTNEGRQYLVNDPDEYHKDRVLFFKKGNTWKDLMIIANQDNIGMKIDQIMQDLENSNPILQGVLPKNYTTVNLPNHNLTELINLFSSIKHEKIMEQDFDLLGRTYEFFLGKFSSFEASLGGEFYTPKSIVKLIIAVIQPSEGKIFDPTCGSGGMFVQSIHFHNNHQNNNNPNNLSFYAQEFKEEIWRICKMNLVLRGIDISNIKQGDCLLNDKHPTLKADYIMANPPFNVLEWGYNKLKNDKRWVFGVPSYSKAGGNYAFMQHMLFHLEKNGKMGLVLANGALTSRGNEYEIRKQIVDADLIDCVIALPNKLFYNVKLPVTLWFFSKNKDDGKSRKRNGETLFIFAEKIFSKVYNEKGNVEKSLNQLSDKQIQEISEVYQSYIGKKDSPKYQDRPGFCKVVTTDVIKNNKYFLTPGLYVGSSQREKDTEPFDKKMRFLSKNYLTYSRQSEILQKQIEKNLGEFSFGK